MVYCNHTHCSYSPMFLPWPQYHYHRYRGNNNNQQDRYGDQHYHKQCGCTPCPFINAPPGRVGGCEGDVGRGCGHTLYQLPLTPRTRLVHWRVPLGLKRNVNSNLRVYVCMCMGKETCRQGNQTLMRQHCLLIPVLIVTVHQWSIIFHHLPLYSSGGYWQLLWLHGTPLEEETPPEDETAD